jgi:trehalose-6-phosphate synthase
MDKTLIIASNRLPFVVKMDDKKSGGEPKRGHSAGGLVTALAPLVAKTGGYWIGWAGTEFREDMLVPESTDPTSITHDIKSSQIVPIHYTNDVYQNFYNGMCNASLWPLMHSLPILTVFKSEFWNAYVDVNVRFAHAALNTIKDLDELHYQVEIFIEKS